MQNPTRILSQTVQAIADDARSRFGGDVEIEDRDAAEFIGKHEIEAWLTEQAGLRVDMACIVADIASELTDAEALALLKGPLAAALKAHIAHDLAHRAMQLSFHYGPSDTRGPVVSNANGYVGGAL